MQAVPCLASKEGAAHGQPCCRCSGLVLQSALKLGEKQPQEAKLLLQQAMEPRPESCCLLCQHSQVLTSLD